MKVAILINEDFSAWKLRQNIIKTLVARDVDLTVICPDGPYVSKLVELGATHIPLPMHRFASPLRDLKLCYDMYRVLQKLQPDIVHTMTIKPNTYGAVAARLAGVRKILALVCGLGFSFLSQRGWKQTIKRAIAVGLYRIAGRFYDGVWFANPDDRDLFVELGIIDRSRAVVTMGEGVDVDEYMPGNVPAAAAEELRREFSIDPATVVVLMMVARVVWSKGVKEFVETSRRAAEWPRATRFLLVGPLEPESPDAVPLSYLQSDVPPNFTHVGFRSDVKQLVAMADVVTLPSFYREGCPLVLIEGLAMGKPIVTTDNVGCRQVVDEGRNGFLVPIQNTAAFADAVEKLVGDETLRATQGRCSREKAVKEFADEIIMEQVMTRLYGMPPKSTKVAAKAA